MIPHHLSQAPGLTAAGMTLMVACIGLVCGLLSFCYYRLLRTPRPTDPHRDSPDTDAKR